MATAKLAEAEQHLAELSAQSPLRGWQASLLSRKQHQTHNMCDVCEADVLNTRSALQPRASCCATLQQQRCVSCGATYQSMTLAPSKLELACWRSLCIACPVAADTVCFSLQG